MIQLKIRLSYWEELECLLDKDKFDRDFKDKLGMSFRSFHNRWQNFLKHADKDPDAQMEPITAKHLALVILTAILNYNLLTQHLTVEMKFFFAWIAAAEPQLMKLVPHDAASKLIAEARSYISGDAYDRDTLETINAAMTGRLGHV